MTYPMPEISKKIRQNILKNYSFRYAEPQTIMNSDP